MHLFRRIALAGSLFVFALTAVVTPGYGQPPGKVGKGLRKDTYVSGEVRSRVNEMRDGKRSFTNKAELPGYRDDLKKMAEFLVFRVTHEEYYKQIELRKDELKTVPPGSTVADVLEDVNRYVLKPTLDRKLVAEQADYIKEMGTALDAALRKVIPPYAPEYNVVGEPVPPNLGPGPIRVNAARMLAIAAQSGAPAHAPTIIALLKDPKTRPEVLIYVLKAAENLLAAYDTFKVGEKDQAKHTIPDVELYELAKTLEAIAGWERAPWMKTPEPAPAPAPAAAPESPPPAAKAAEPKPADPKAADPKAPPAPPAAPKAVADPKAAPAPPPKTGVIENTPEEPLTNEQVAVLRFYRRAALRALAQIRFPIVAHPNGSAVAYPLWPLAKVAVNDASVSPPAAPDEVAEAVIGLCNYHQFRGVEVDVLLDAIAVGVLNFVAPKTDKPDDKSITWRVYAARAEAALDQFRKHAANNAGLAPKVGKIQSLADAAIGNVLNQLQRTGPAQRVDPPAVMGWRSSNPVATLQPFTDAKGMVLKPVPRGNR